MAAAGFTVHRDQISRLVTKFDDAYRGATAATSYAQQAADLPAPGGDPFSAAAVGMMGPNGVARYQTASTVYAASLNQVSYNLKQAHGGYDLAEEQAARRLAHNEQ